MNANKEQAEAMFAAGQRDRLTLRLLRESGEAPEEVGEIIAGLGQLLDDSFLPYDGAGEVPSQIHGYLSTNHKDLRGLAKDHPALIAKAQDRWYVPDPNKAQDLEEKREKALLKEFAAYQAHTGRGLKEFRVEVLHASRPPGRPRIIGPSSPSPRRFPTRHCKKTRRP